MTPEQEQKLFDNIEQLTVGVSHLSGEFKRLEGRLDRLENRFTLKKTSMEERDRAFQTNEALSQRKQTYIYSLVTAATLSVIVTAITLALRS